MSVSYDDSELRYGNMVAVEGNVDMVATQLRLLPPSSKILVLPALSTALPSVSAEPFEARKWVHLVHNAFTIRSQTARSFLKHSTNMQPRLVFINGGSVGARVECICRIAEQMTNGRIAEAEAIFNDIVKDGVAGILRPDYSNDMKEGSVIPGLDADLEELVEPYDYRGAIAMEAADRLDRETADLQLSTGTLDFAIPRKSSRRPFSIQFNDQSYRDSIGEYPQNEDNLLFSNESIKRTVVTVPDELEDDHLMSAKSKRSTFGFLPSTTYSPDLRKSCLMDLEGLDQEEAGEEGEDTFLSNGDKYEVSSGLIEVGHAHVIRVAESSNALRKIRSVRSLDRLVPGTIKTKPRSRSLTPKLISNRGMAHRAAALKGYSHGRRASLSDLEKAPETSFVRAFSTLIKKPSSLTNSSKSVSHPSSVKSPRPIYVDRGTDARSIHSVEEAMPLTPDTDEAENPPFEPVFAVIEDLVIHFTDGSENSPLESVVRSYKNGSYPVFPVSEPEDQAYLSSPQPTRITTDERLRQLSQWTIETDDIGYHRRHENHHFDTQPEFKQVWWPQRKGTRIENPAIHTQAPLSPATTPPPRRTSIAHRFHRFSPINSKTTTGIQNSLRAVLNVHFPPELTNYRQYSVPVEADRLWKPVFRDSDGQSQEGRTVDQIIAIGAEDGVKGNFFNEIAGQVERLGTKKNGTTRSGKVDIRFLIASAMQTFTKQPLSYQSQSSRSPFSSPMLLASLLVPQLEAYLASNTSIRLLIIHYSSSHLPTILALRYLVGAETFRIAGILDFHSGDTSTQDPPPSPFFRPLIGNRLSNNNVARLNSRSRSRGCSRSGSAHSKTRSAIDFIYDSSEPIRTSFCHANYILHSTATDAEISNFMARICSHLIEKSSFYTPEPTLYSTLRSSGASTLSPSLPPNSMHRSNSRNSRSSATTLSNTSRPMTPQSREREHITCLSGNIIRPRANLNSYASSIKTLKTNGSNPNMRGQQIVPNSPDSSTNSSFIHPSIRRISPPSTSHSSINQSQPRPYSPAPPSTTTRSSRSSSNPSPKIFNSPSIITLQTVQTVQSQSQNLQTQTKKNHSPTQIPISFHFQPQSPVTREMISQPQSPVTSNRGSSSPTQSEKERESEREWANFYVGESEEEDEIDRILMPRVPKRAERRKGGSRKALKWLGLA